MELLRDIKAVRNPTFILAFFDLLFLVMPGVAVIYLLLPDLFEKLDWVRLVLVSASFTIPFVFLNTLLIAMHEKLNGEKENLFFEFSMSAILTGLVIYGFLLTAYLLHRPMHQGFYALLIAEIVALVILSIRERLSKNRTK